MEAGCLESAKTALKQWLQFAAKQAPRFSPPPPQQEKVVADARPQPNHEGSQQSPADRARPMSRTPPAREPFGIRASSPQPPTAPTTARVAAVAEAGSSSPRIQAATPLPPGGAVATRVYHEVLQSLAASQAARMTQREEQPNSFDMERQSAGQAAAGTNKPKLPYYYHIWTYNPRFYSHRYE
jgi:hypothetical protein